MQISPYCEQLGVSLEQQLSAMTTLLELLQTEHEALKGNSLADIKLCAETKQQLINQISIINQARQTLISQARINGSNGSLEKMLSTAPQQFQHQIQASEQTILELAEQCKRQNLINGLIATKRGQQIHQLLSVLTGQADEKSYSAKGKITLTDINAKNYIV